ncbi:MAG: hypothetical protein JW807_14480 [Spirochaetes bacterium]|nr:hypothetical protein [Spirochaetota bacterium]
MISLQKINLEYKSTALFGCTALILSFVTGFMAGIQWNYVLIRSLVLTIIFSAIGFGICYILRKFVPEAYEFLSMRAAGGKSAAEAEEIDIENGAGPDSSSIPSDEGMGEPEAVTDAVSAAPSEDEFKELDNEALAHYSTGTAGGSGINTAAGRLGKHVLEKEKLAKYEPKIMAQAVRTMMSRDKE